MTEYDKEETDELTDYSYEGIFLGVFHVEPEFAQLEVSRYPDGTPTNQLYPEDLRELARMFEDAADELEDD